MTITAEQYLTWRKQEHFIEYIFGIPISQGSLAKMHKWFAESLEPVIKEWLKYIQQPVYNRKY